MSAEEVNATLTWLQPLKVRDDDQDRHIFLEKKKAKQLKMHFFSSFLYVYVLK